LLPKCIYGRHKIWVGIAWRLGIGDGFQGEEIKGDFRTFAIWWHLFSE